MKKSFIVNFANTIDDSSNDSPLTPSEEDLKDTSIMESSLATDFLNQYPEEKRQQISEAIEYIRIFCRHFSIFNGETFQPLHAPFGYYNNRNKILNELPFSEEDFYQFDLLQDSIKDLGLKPQPTFEFISFLYNTTLENFLSKQVSCGSILEDIINEFDKTPDSELDMTIKINGKLYKFSNTSFIYSLLYTYKNSNYKGLGLTETCKKRTRERTIQYTIIKTLLDYLPTKIKKPSNVKFVQAERNFSLCVLHLCKLLLGDQSFVCTKDNNATFDKLMRDFKDTKITVTENLI